MLNSHKIFKKSIKLQFTIWHSGLWQFWTELFAENDHDLLGPWPWDKVTQILTDWFLIISNHSTEFHKDLISRVYWDVHIGMV